MIRRWCMCGHPESPQHAQSWSWSGCVALKCDCRQFRWVWLAPWWHYRYRRAQRAARDRDGRRAA